MSQEQQKEWHDQWSLVEDNELFLFEDWIYPTTLDDFAGKDVVEFGCGGGQHTSFVSSRANTITSVDLNCVEIAEERNKTASNITFVEGDIAKVKLGKKFDIGFSIGVIHHTDDPEQSVKNLIDHIKPGGKVIVWVYSQEGNALVEKVVEPIRKTFLTNMPRDRLLTLSKVVTFLMYLPIYTLYLLPLRFLPFYEYFQNFRKLSFYRNTLNVFDKLNAPQVQFISKARATGWLKEQDFMDIHITPYKSVSWRISGIKR